MAGESWKILAEVSFVVLMSLMAMITVGYMIARRGFSASAIPITIITLAVVAIAAHQTYRLIHESFAKK